MQQTWITKKAAPQYEADYLEVKEETSIVHTVEELSHKLSSILELEVSEANIYLNLLRRGPITASILSKELDIDRTKVYRTIERLLSKGLVSTTFSYPKLCTATNPKDVLELILKRKENEITRIKKYSQEIIEQSNKISTTNYSITPTFHIVQGTLNIFSYIEKLIEDSTNVVYIVTSLKHISTMYHTNIPDKIKICERNGGQVRLLTEINDNRLKLYIDRLKATETRTGKLSSNGIIVVSKDKQMVMSDATINPACNPSVKTESALCTNSHELVNNIFTLCTLLWKNSQPLKMLKNNMAKKNNEQ